MRRLGPAVLLLLLLGALPAAAQVVWDTGGLKGDAAGGYLAAQALMADSGAMVAGDTGAHRPGVWSAIFKCAGIPVSVGTPPALAGGAGIYTFEKYNAAGVLSAQLVAHSAMSHDDLQSIPAFTLLAGEGLRIRTLVPLQGLFSCSIWRYTSTP